MPFEVLMTEDAARDLEEIYDYIARHGTQNSADHVLEKIEMALVSSSDSPLRGVYPPELAALGIREYREIFFKPYRIIYRIMEINVYILLIVDGPRDMQTLLGRRLLGS
ncbi:MAG: type II toxin-antitoxin system RelE/ParE family toxin [Deltaproteobacteria bacterium]|nr:type II toxin-antitoxin system RelE/ParE family toxin [Deltaproteobacteria bacterium]